MQPGYSDVPYGLITNTIPFLEQSDEREAIALVELLARYSCMHEQERPMKQQNEDPSQSKLFYVMRILYSWY